MTPENKNLLTLKVGGKVYAGWKFVTVRQGVEQIAGTFDLSITERWPAQPKEWSIPPGEICEILIGDDPVINGYVDAVAVTYDSGSHDINVRGRDRTGDLVDCSAPPLAFGGITFLQIAEKLVKPYGIAITDQTKNSGKRAALPKQAAQSGESVHRTLEKIARSEGVLLVSDGKGGLLVTRAGLGGDSGTVLKFGENILRANFEQSHAALYSEIAVKGQASAAGRGQFDVASIAPKGFVKREKTAQSGNSQVARYRPLTLVSETQANAQRCQKRAEWEAANREAKARKITLTVQGWRQADGSLWRINQRVRVTCPWMRVDEQWLVAAVIFKLDEGGTTAELSLVGQKAFDLLPEIPSIASNSAKFNVAGKP